MFYLTYKFHDNRINTFGFIEGGGAFEDPPGPGTPKKPGRNRVNNTSQAYPFHTYKYTRHTN